MTRYRRALPQTRGRFMITDGGLEPDLIFHRGFDLPQFSAYPLVHDAAGSAALVDYSTMYAGVARAAGVGLVLESPTWRANPDWAPLLGHDLDGLDEANRSAVALMETVRDSHAQDVSPVVAAGFDQLTAITMTYADEAIGIVRAAVRAAVPAAISFTVETDGRPWLTAAART
jgi:homocysteine S-methyltransferase